MVINEIVRKNDKYCNFCLNREDGKYYELRRSLSGGLVVNICNECIEEILKNNLTKN